MKGKLRKIILWSITAIIALTASLFNTKAYAEEIEGKVLRENGDGTYELSLSVTGQSEKKVNKANVVVILDVSGSMDYGTSYTENTQGGYGLINSEYEFLYTRSWNGNYSKIANGTYNGTVYYAGSDGYYHQYNGTRYSASETRLEAAKRAVNNLANSLLKNNTTENPDIIEIALVTFSTNASTAQNATTSYSTFSGVVNGLEADGGTNWEAALKQAKNVSFGADDKDTTYVIFVSDGNPTFHVTNGGYGNYNNDYSVYGSGQEETTNITRSYDQAKDDAKALVDAKYEFYTIGIYGNVDRMQDITTYSGVLATDHYFSADDTAKLESALNTILQKIETAGIGETTIEDGTTQSVSTDSGTLNLLTIDYTSETNNSFRYWLSFPVTQGTDGSYSGKLNNKDAKVTQNSDGTYTCTWGDNNEFSLKGTVIDGMFKYQWTGANDLYNKEAPKATLSGSKVNWDLKDLDVLLNGVTYTVTFNVWPSQTTYDLISDLDNGIKKYEDLDENIRRYLIKNGNTYTLLTNTTATLTYTDTRNDEGEQTDTYKNPDPVSTDVSKMTVNKLWENDLDKHQNDVTKVELNVLKDGVKYGKTITLTKDSNGDWKDEVFISTGLMSITKDNNGNVISAIIREKGHNYTFEEIEDGTYYWDLAVEVVRPMLVNENNKMVLKTFVKVMENAPEIGDSNVIVIDGVTYYKIDGEVYYIREDNATVMNAINIRRSNLNITKVVTGEAAPKDSEFTFELTVTDYNGNNVWFSIYDPASGTVKDDKYVSAEGLEKELKDGEFTGYYNVKSGTKITVIMQATWNLRFTNLPTGSTYIFEEKMMPENFAFIKAEATEISARVDLLPNDAVSNEDGTYTFNGVTYTKVEENDEVYYTYIGKATINDKVVSGKIFVGNTTYVVTYTNDYLKTEVNGNKKWEDASNQDGIRPDEIEVKLVAKVDGKEIEELEKSTKVVAGTDGSWSFKFSDLNRYYDGKVVEYSIDEVKVNGYETDITTDENGNYIITNEHATEKISVSGTKTWDDEVNTTNRPKEITIILTAKVKNEIIFTKNEKIGANEDGTWSYSFTGLDKYQVGAVKQEIEYIISEEAVTGYDTKVDGYNVTNTLKTKEVEVRKEWKDEIDSSNRVNEITVELYADDTLYTSAKLNEENKWTYKFTNLPMYINGKEVTYNVKEISVNGYESKVTGTEKDGYVITNTLLTTSVSGTKSWIDNDNQDGKRPTEITVDLFANGTKVNSIKVTKDGGWTYAFNNLPRYMSGKEVTYSVKEQPVGGYTPSYNGYNITNTHQVETTEITITKTWDDMDDISEIRPDSITVYIYANGKEYKTITISKDDNWVKTIELPKYSNGKEIEYAIGEEDVFEYESSIDGFNITNKHELGIGDGPEEEPEEPIIEPEELPPQTGVTYNNSIIYILLILLSIISVNVMIVKED